MTFKVLRTEFEVEGTHASDKVPLKAAPRGVPLSRCDEDRYPSEPAPYASYLPEPAVIIRRKPRSDSVGIHSNRLASERGPVRGLNSVREELLAGPAAMYIT